MPRYQYEIDAKFSVISFMSVQTLEIFRFGTVMLTIQVFIGVVIWGNI